MDNAEQIDYWNGKVGEKWVRHSERLDGLLAPFIDAVLANIDLQSGEQVLDIGCGGGALTLAAAKAVGATGSACGLDVSAPLLALARRRAEAMGVSATFDEVDAARFRADAPVDAMISRFGVMFFSYPVAAFTNLRASLKPGGRLCFVCWQGLSENAWARAPLAAALPLLPEPPPPPMPGAPGPFAFADKDRVVGMLRDAGWQEIEVAPWLGKLSLPGRTPAEVASFMVELGPVARLVAEAGVDLSAVESALTDALAPHAAPDGRVALPAAAWIVSAVND